MDAHLCVLYIHALRTYIHTCATSTQSKQLITDQRFLNVKLRELVAQKRIHIHTYIHTCATSTQSKQLITDQRLLNVQLRELVAQMHRNNMLKTVKMHLPFGGVHGVCNRWVRFEKAGI